MSDTDQTEETHTPLTAEHIAAAETLAGRPPTSDEQRALMLENLPDTREQLRTLRDSDLARGKEPAIRFTPLAAPAPESVSGTPSLSSWRDGTVAEGAEEPDRLAFAGAVELARLLRTGAVTSRRLTEIYLERLKRLGPSLRCIVNLVPDEEALAQADRADAELASGRDRGPLHGIPYGAKDLFAWHGLPTTFGAKPYENQVLSTDAAVLRLLEEAGAVLIAKLSMGELAMGDTWFGGMTRNPWQPESGSSGSSAGSGSAVAAGLVGFALGTETWGSIVSPSVVCGVTGLRPTFGRVSREGAMALAWSMDKIGPMARRVEDCAIVFEAIRDSSGPFVWNPEEGLSGLRVGIDMASFEKLAANEEIRPLQPIYDRALRVLETLTGGPLIPVRLPEKNPAYEALPGLIIGVEGAASFASLIAEGGLDALAQQGSGNWPNIFRLAAMIPATEYVQAQRVRTHLQEAFAAAIKDVDIYVTVPRVGPSLAYTNLTGHPELVTRCGRTEDGQPISLSFVGDLCREDALLRLGHAFERATEWHREWPHI